MASLCRPGGLAEFVAVRRRLRRGPSGMGDEEAAGFLVAYGTSHVALSGGEAPAGRDAAGAGAAGGVGLTAVELGALMGARVMAAARGRRSSGGRSRGGGGPAFDTGR